MSTTAKTDSMVISRTMGTAKSTIAVFRGAAVKSTEEPRIAARTAWPKV